MIATGVMILALGLILIFATSGAVAGVFGWVLVTVGAVALLVIAADGRDGVRDRNAAGHPPVR